jgi:hypothetical protein
LGQGSEHGWEEEIKVECEENGRGSPPRGRAGAPTPRPPQLRQPSRRRLRRRRAKPVWSGGGFPWPGDRGRGGDPSPHFKWRQSRVAVIGVGCSYGQSSSGHLCFSEDARADPSLVVVALFFAGGGRLGAGVADHMIRRLRR